MAICINVPANLNVGSEEVLLAHSVLASNTASPMSVSPTAVAHSAPAHFLEQSIEE